jgi:hypothetical protein
MVSLDDGADFGSFVMTVRSIFELRRRDKPHNNQRDDYRRIEPNSEDPGLDETMEAGGK